MYKNLKYGNHQQEKDTLPLKEKEKKNRLKKHLSFFLII